MHPIIRNILAVILGWFIGGAVNMGIVMLGHKVMLIPGIDPNDMEGLANALHTLGGEYFIFPFLAHAVGTLVGAIVAAGIAATHKMKFALAIGVLFLIGGIAACFMIPAPAWFIVLDLVVAYIPMAWLGGKIGARICSK
ncbi:hypothetical protein [Moheibacter lacus]|uniref:Uncharacterized protein n=1 Tax=Moheibacter lacus TaxID=2745851 RepID=A0A838ZQA1_9FLAO|nr:hypothetical protein [Moheibacter lacus]MBA5629917.1 hypothetical protein [Moheibacter lacus]